MTNLKKNQLVYFNPETLWPTAITNKPYRVAYAESDNFVTLILVGYDLDSPKSANPPPRGWRVNTQAKELMNEAKLVLFWIKKYREKSNIVLKAILNNIESHSEPQIKALRKVIQERENEK